jgi:hypothetical protein
VATATASPKTAAKNSATNTNELVRFLLARFDEDDEQLKRCARPGAAPGVPFPIDRLRSEALSRRRVVGSLQQLVVLRDQPSEKPVRDGAVHALRALAAPYSAHPNFHPEWKTSPRP